MIDYARFETSQRAETDAQKAVITLVLALIAEIKRLNQASTDTDTQARIDAFAADAETRTAALVAATLENTVPSASKK